MRLNKLTNWLGSGHTGETLAVFGDAHLVKHRDGKLELRGGTHADHIAAREWCSLFLHNAVITTVGPRGLQTPTRKLQIQLT